MTPQVDLNGRDRVAQATSTAPTLSPLTARGETTAAHEPTFAERQATAMGWAWSALGMFALLAGLALAAAAIFNVGFVGWLVSVGVMGFVILATVVAVAFLMLRPSR